MNLQGDILRRLRTARLDKDKAQAQEDAAWADLMAVADEIAGPGQPYRYLDRELEEVVGRTVAKAPARLDVEALLADKEFPRRLKAKVRTTREVTEVDGDMLAGYIQAGEVPASLVERHTTIGEPSVRRFGPRPATKEEKAELAALREAKEHYASQS